MKILVALILSGSVVGVLGLPNLLTIRQSATISPLSCTSGSSSSSPTTTDDESSLNVPTSHQDRRDFMRSALLTAAAASSSGVLFPSFATAGDADQVSKTSLASSSLQGQIALPPLGLGAWSWGDSFFWGYDQKNDDQLKQVFNYAVEASSPALFDTAEIYGFGRSETLLGQFEKDCNLDRPSIQIATKFAAYPFRTSPQDVVKACEASLKRLNRDSIDLYQIHFPNAWSNEAYWDGLAMAFDKGLVKAVGVSNYGVDATRACHDALAKRGIQLATNQIQFSLLYRYPLDNGLLQTCQDLGVQVLSYSPLALGMLTGKYTSEAPPSGPRQGIFQQLQATPDYNNLLVAMKQVASAHQDATLSQVALNWAMAKNTIPIPGARTLNQVSQNYQTLQWKLSASEVETLDHASAQVKTFLKPEVSPFAKEDVFTHLKMFDS